MGTCVMTTCTTSMLKPMARDVIVCSEVVSATLGEKMNPSRLPLFDIWQTSPLVRRDNKHLNDDEFSKTVVNAQDEMLWVIKWAKKLPDGNNKYFDLHTAITVYEFFRVRGYSPGEAREEVTYWNNQANV